MISLFRTTVILSLSLNICGAIAYINHPKSSDLKRPALRVLHNNIHKDEIKGTIQDPKKSYTKETGKGKRTENDFPKPSENSSLVLPRECKSPPIKPKQAIATDPHKAEFVKPDPVSQVEQSSDVSCRDDEEEYRRLKKKCWQFFLSDQIRNIRIHDKHCQHKYSISILEKYNNTDGSLVTIYKLTGHPSINTVTATSTTRSLTGISTKEGIFNTYAFLSLEKLTFSLKNQTEKQVIFDNRKEKKMHQTILLMVYSPRHLYRNFYPQLTQPKHRETDKNISKNDKSVSSLLASALDEAETLIANGELVRCTPLCQSIMINPLSPYLLNIIITMKEHKITETQFFKKLNRHSNNFYVFDVQKSFCRESISFWRNIRTYFTPEHYFMEDREHLTTIIKQREETLAAIEARKLDFIQASRILEEPISPSLQFTIDRVSREVSTMVVDTFDKFSFAMTVKHDEPEAHVYPYPITTLLQR